MTDELVFEVTTPLGFSVRRTRRHWDYIVSNKHPALAGHAADVAAALREPDEIRLSRKDDAVFLFYRGGLPRWPCAVAKVQDGSGFLITAYPTDAIKIGARVWPTSQ